MKTSPIEHGHEGLTIVVTRAEGTPPPGSPTFVLVHGIAVSSRYFAPTTAELVKLGTVYLVDLPGYGAAPKAAKGRDVTISDHANVLASWLAASGLENPVVVGHSMGAQVVSRLAVDHPELTNRIVLMSPTMPAGERSLLTGGWLLAIDSVRNPPSADAVIMADYLFRCGIPYFFRQTKHLFGDHIEDRLAEVRAKTLVICGDKDLIVPRSWSQRVAEEIPDARLEIVSGPHVIMYHEPAHLAAVIAGHAA
jgi:pimeloyl-ACP methyl ester carboxylesterase